MEKSSEEDTILSKRKTKYTPGKSEKSCIIRFPREYRKIAQILMKKGGWYTYTEEGFVIPLGTLDLIRLEEIPFSIYRPQNHRNQQNHYRRPRS